MEELIDLNDPRVAEAFNSWMVRYLQHPEQFSREWQAVGEFASQREHGIKPTYGEVCVAYLKQLIAEN